MPECQCRRLSRVHLTYVRVGPSGLLTAWTREFASGKFLGQLNDFLGYPYY